MKSQKKRKAAKKALHTEEAVEKPQAEQKSSNLSDGEIRNQLAMLWMRVGALEAAMLIEAVSKPSTQTSSESSYTPKIFYSQKPASHTGVPWN